MAKRKKNILALPEQAKKDARTLTSILDRWAGEIEDVMKSAFEWAKKHKLLVLLSIGLVAFYRYWLTEPEEEGYDDEEY